ncbi:MAG: KpsF/GutQ family sugar-phosphate isomerase [Actinomycetota bacterium]
MQPGNESELVGRPAGPRDLLRAEAAAISAAADRLDSAQFADAVRLLRQCEGKVVVVGAGTSGLIARKIAATLTSTGSPSFFLHPNDAMHGGLGAVLPGDLVVLVSNSGETSELVALLPYLRHRGVPKIAIVGNLSSSLAAGAEVALDAAADHEICPFNLAPTSSTTVALAIGDALAVSLYQHRGLTPEQFALNHPSGALGRRLTLRVSDVMRPAGSIPSVSRATTWIDVLTAITDGGIGATAVLDQECELRGIITDGDVRRALQRIPPEQVAAARAQDIMSPNPVQVDPQVLVYVALQEMENRPSQISVLPVVDAGRFVGMVRLHDLVRAGA